MEAKAAASLVLFLIWIRHTRGLLQTRGSFFSGVEDSPHGPLTGSPLTRYDQVRGSLECGLLCLRTDGCLWFIYQPGMESCSPQNDLIVFVEGGRQNSSLLPTYTFVQNTACIANSGYVYDPVSHFCFRFVEEAKRWQDANDTCTVELSHLVAIDNNQKRDAINKYLTAQGVSYECIWIEVNGLDITSWATWDRKPIGGYFNWAPSEPHGLVAVDKKCVCMKKIDSWKWHDRFCRDNFAFICEKDL